MWTITPCLPRIRAEAQVCPYGSVYRSVSGSGKSSWSIRQPPKPPPALRRGQVNSYLSSRLQARPCPSSPHRGVTSFSLLDRARPVFSFSSGRKRENGGCIAPAIAGIQSPPPARATTPPSQRETRKKRQPPGAVSFPIGLETKSHFTALTTKRVRAKRPMALGITIRLLNISESSQTKSLEARVPRKMKTRAIKV